MLRSAELFSMLPDEDALIRQADALWLAGYAQNARSIWAIAVSRPRAIYNLAMTSQTQAEAKKQYEALIGKTVGSDPYHKLGLIRYSRLMDVRGALVLLNAEGLQDDQDTNSSNTALPAPHSSLSLDALFDLEITKRRTENTEAARMVAETWLLLDRYPQAEYLYQWGAWYFALQRSYAETALLLKAASRHNFAGHWKGIYESLLLIHEGGLDAAEETLSAIPPDDEDWIVAANLGRIYEARQSPARALANYEKAFSIISKNSADSNAKGWKETASRLQVRIAYCHRIMGKSSESRRSLDYALELNPDNLNARLELSRLD
jgi:tetratricopeptide (TPR) repeat protein